MVCSRTLRLPRDFLLVSRLIILYVVLPLHSYYTQPPDYVHGPAQHQQRTWARASSQRLPSIILQHIQKALVLCLRKAWNAAVRLV